MNENGQMTDGNPQGSVFSDRSSSKSAVRLMAALCMSSSFFYAQAQDDDEEIFELSPFEVNAEEDRGYEAQNTLSGTRLNSSTKDLGVTMTILTEQFMEDLGVNNTNDMIDFTPGSEKETTQGGQGASTIYWGDNTMVRGVRVENIVRNQFSTNITGDSYNAGRFEFSRGGNSILFGIGNPAGLINRYTNDAIFTDTNRYRFNIDDQGGTRHEFNTNRVLIEDKLAVRAAIMHEEGENWIKPLFADQDRAYFAATFKPVENLTLKFRAETFDWQRSIASYGIHQDGVTPFLNAAAAAGETVEEHAKVHNVWVWPRSTSPNFGPEFNDWGYSGANTLVFLNGPENEGGTPANWMNKVISGPVQVAGDDSPSLPVDFLPRDWNIFGNSNFQDFQGHNIQAVAQWKVNDKVNLELALNDETVEYDFMVNWGANTLRLDASSTLPNGDPNPNVGRYYIANDTAWRFKQERNLKNLRATASLEYDFEQETDGLGFLGKHNAAILLESAESHNLWDSLWLANTTPNDTGLPTTNGAFPDEPRNGWNGANLIKVINYLDLDTQTIYGPTDPREFQDYANQFDGVNAEWVPSYNNINGNVGKTTVDSFMTVIQSRFWDDRLVSTVGWRADKLDVLSGTIGQDPDGPAGQAVLAKDVPLVYDEVGSAPTPDTVSRGLNYHVIRDGEVFNYLTLYAIQSTTFNTNSLAEDPLRGRSPNTTGDTVNYGVKFGVMDNKVTGVFTVFDVALENELSNNFGKWTDLDLLGTAYGNNTWTGINPSTTRDTRDLVSEGWEFQVNANITDSWRVMMSYDNYTTKFSNVAPVLGQIFEDNRTQWLSDPDLLVQTGDNPRTAQEVFDSAYFEYLTFKAQEGRRTLNERSNKLVFVTGYDIRDGAFKGLGFGADLIWQDEALTGFALDENGLPDPDNPFLGEDLTRLGAHVSYGKKILNDKIDWKIQLNIRNIGGIDPYVVRHGATIDAPTTPVAWYTNRGLPTQYLLSNTFEW